MPGRAHAHAATRGGDVGVWGGGRRAGGRVVGHDASLTYARTSVKALLFPLFAIKNRRINNELRAARARERRPPCTASRAYDADGKIVPTAAPTTAWGRPGFIVGAPSGRLSSQSRIAHARERGAKKFFCRFPRRDARRKNRRLSSRDDTASTAARRHFRRRHVGPCPAGINARY